MIFSFILIHFFLLITRWGIWRSAPLRFLHVCVRLSVPWSAFHVTSFSTIARHFSLSVTSINQTIHGNALLCCSGCYSISLSLLDFRGAYDNGRILLSCCPTKKFSTTTVKEWNLSITLLFINIYHNSALRWRRIKILCHTRGTGCCKYAAGDLGTSIVI